MRNITALTVLVIITFSSFAVNPVYSQEDERKYNFSIGLQTGFVYGRAVEIVYPLPGQTKNELYSELLWDMKPVFYLGAQLDFNHKVLKIDPGFFSSLSFKCGIPADSGNIEDRDWTDPRNSDLTIFSTHTNKTLALLKLDAVVGFGTSLPKFPHFYIKPFISFSWMYSSFSGRNGYGKSFLSGKEETIENQKVITYKQQWLLVGAGLSAGTKILFPFTFEISFQISPFTHCTAIDEHIRQETVYHDYAAWGLFLEPKCSISYTVRRYELSLALSYRHIGRTTIGNSYKNEKNKDFELIPNKAGAAFSAFDTSLLFKIHL
jgi:outer membrane protease